jgi:hypothetical protein
MVGVVSPNRRNKDMVKHVETTLNLYNEPDEANKKLMLLPAWKSGFFKWRKILKKWKKLK